MTNNPSPHYLATFQVSTQPLISHPTGAVYATKEAPAAYADAVVAILKARRPAYSLPAACYRSTAFYAREWECLFNDSWFYAGHASQIPASGDYFLFELCHESVIVVRDDDGVVRALANVCRHRGSRVCLNPQGNTCNFVCGYHGWVYDLRGKLRSKRHMGGDFDPAAFGLKHVPLTEFQGLLWINLNPAAERFDASAIAVHLAPFELGATHVAATRSYTIAANWKLAIENYHECYHCAPAHPEYARSHSLKEPEQRTLALRHAMEACTTGIGYGTVDTKTASGMELYYGRYPLYSGYLSGTEDGKPAAPLLGKLSAYDGGASDVSFGAFSFLLVYSDYAVVYCFKPLTVQSSTVTLSWLVRSDAKAGVDYDCARLCWLWEVTTQADQTIISNNQRGINSAYYAPGPLSTMESYVARFHDWYAATMLASSRSSATANT